MAKDYNKFRVPILRNIFEDKKISNMCNDVKRTT